MWIFDVESLAFLAVNDAAVRHYGYSRQEFLGMSLTDIGTPEEAPGLPDRLAQLPAGLSQSRTCKHRKSDGSILYVDVASQNLEFEGRSARLSVLYDVTEQKKSAEASLESEEKWRSLVENAPNIIVITDCAGTIQFINRTASGYQDDRVIGSTLFDYIPADHHHVLKDAMQRVMATGRAGQYEIPVLNRLQTTDWYLNNIAPIVRDGQISAFLFVSTDITEQKKLLEAMEETRERFSLVSRASNDAVWDWDLLTNDVWWNEGVRSLFGYNPDEVIPNSGWWRKRIHPDDYERIKNDLENAIAGGKSSWSGEYRFRRADGSYAFIFDRGYIMRKDGVPVRMLGAMMDITERKRAETLNAALYRIAHKASMAEDMDEFYSAMHSIVAELMYARNFYIALYDEATDSINFPYLVDEVDESIDAEGAKGGLTGYVLRTGEPALVTPACFNELVEKGEVTSVGAASVDWLGVPLKSGDKIFGVLVVQTYTEGVRYGVREKEVLTFVSQHVANALLRRRSEEALRKSEEKYRTLFEESKDAILISTPDGLLLDTNQAGLELLGYETREDLHGANLVRDHYLQNHQRFQDEINERGYVKDFEFPLKKRTGEKIFARETATAVRDESGKIIAYRAIVRDVTHLKELEAELLQIQKMEAVGQLAGGVAHDFNNTLMAITGYCELLQMKIPPGESLKREVMEILKAAERGAGLTRQLLAFSRKQVLEPKILDLNQVLQNMESMLVRLIGEDIDLVLRFDFLLQTVKADPGQIEQVIMNLAVNARDAMPRGGRLLVETSNLNLEQGYLEQPPGRYSVLSVRDTGAGMDPKTLSRIFEPFFTTKEKGKGTGLGLATVYGIVKQSGGYIWADSEPGSGTHFRICLPCVIAPGVAQTAPSLREITPAQSGTILLVDDDDSVRNAIADLLKMNGYKIIQASDGKEALEMSRRYEGTIDLLITDVVMPRMGGRELAELLLTENNDLKVLFMSGYDERAIAHGTDNDLAMAFLAKPASRESLLLKIRQLI